MSFAPQFQCPICQTPLQVQGQSPQRQLVCEQNHSFDYAKEGYVNLLPVQQKKSLQPGDDKNMVLARREFLQLDHYDFMRQSLIQRSQELLVSSASPVNVIDLGCGEGYYTNELQKQIQSNANVYGIDISKSAVKYAAKRNSAVHYAVATNAHLPFSDKKVDLIVNVFAPLKGEECKRILTPTGNILSVSPGPNHLFELKQSIYQAPEVHEAPKAPAGFRIIEQWPLTQTIQIDSAKAFENLLTMTPFGWKANEDMRDKMAQALPINMTFDFVISKLSVDTDQVSTN